jgi:hypothetical protein
MGGLERVIEVRMGETEGDIHRTNLWNFRESSDSEDM